MCETKFPRVEHLALESATLTIHFVSEDGMSEVFEVDATVLAELDAIEAFYPDEPADKSEYIRDEVVVQMDDAELTLSAWFYRFNRSIAGKRHIEYGDYLKFLDETGFVPQ